MEKLFIEQTKFTPKVLLDFEKGIIEIEGDSLPENTNEFYKPLMSALDNYLSNPKEKSIINLKLTYFNSSSSKLLYNFFEKLEEASSDYDIEINWCYEEDNVSMEEAGSDFAEDFEDIQFNLVTI